MTRTQKRNARKKRAAGRIAHRVIQFSIETPYLSCTVPDIENGVVKKLPKPFFKTDDVCYHCVGFDSNCMFSQDAYHSVVIDTIETNASGLESDLLNRIKGAYNECYTQNHQDDHRHLACFYQITQGSEVIEGELEWLVETEEKVVADVVAAVFMQGRSQSLQIS